MSLLVISPQAEQDLLDIWLYIAQDSPLNADRFLDRLNDTAQRLADFQDMGTARPELAEGVLCFPVEHYVLYYRKQITGVELVRVLHASRDIEQIF